MSTKVRTNYWVDVAIFVCFLCVAITGLMLEDASSSTASNAISLRNLHSWLGLATVALSLVHLVLHWKWWLNAMRRFSRLAKPVRTNFVIDCVLLGLFALATETGLELWLGEGGESEGGPHAWTSLLILLTVAVHIIKHWKWIVTTTRRMFFPKAAVKPARSLASRRIGQ